MCINFTYDFSWRDWNILGVETFFFFQIDDKSFFMFHFPNASIIFNDLEHAN